jgi:hypothetical protein
MALSTSEIESLRHHLGYGNIGATAGAYSPDGFRDLFTDVISPTLSTGTETTATTAVTAGSTTTVTPAAMTDISANVALVVDTGSQAESVIVKATTATTFTAYFEKAHTAAGYPIATMSGLARLRLLLWDADKAWMGLNSSSVGNTAGIKRVDEIEFFGKGQAVLKGKSEHYKSIVWSISHLVQVAPRWAERGGTRLEAY